MEAGAGAGAGRERTEEEDDAGVMAMRANMKAEMVMEDGGEEEGKVRVYSGRISWTPFGGGRGKPPRHGVRITHSGPLLARDHCQ